MPYKINATCPCCNKQANGYDEITEKFGWRTMENGKKIPQSYCRACRKAGCVASEPCKVRP